MRVCRALGAGFAPAIFAAHAAAAPADSAPFSLTVSAPAECPSTDALRAEVLRLSRVGADSSRRLDAKIVVHRAADGSFTLELRTELEGVGGERSFEGSSCQAVSDAATLTLALMLNPEVEQGEPGEPAPAPPATPAPTVQRPPPSVPPPRAKESGPRVRGKLGAFAGGQTGILPKVGFDLGVSLEVGLGPASLGLGVSYDPAQDVRVTGGIAGARLWAGSARLVGCWNLLDPERSSFGPCAGVELGRIAGEGLGVTDPDEGAIFWTSALLGATASLELAPSVHACGTISALWAPERPQVFLEQIGKVHEPRALAGRVQLGAAVDLW